LALAFEELSFFSDHFEILGVFAADPFRALETSQTDRARPTGIPRRQVTSGGA